MPAGLSAAGGSVSFRASLQFDSVAASATRGRVSRPSDDPLKLSHSYSRRLPALG